MAMGMGKTVPFILLLVSCLPCSVRAQDVWITLNGVTYANNSIVTMTDIGIGSAALVCKTVSRSCCSSANPETQWYFPNGSQVLNNPSLPYQRNRGTRPGRVILHHNSESTITGIFQCDILGASQVQSLYVGIYTSTTGGPRIQGDIQFQLTSEVDAATPVFTLTCTSTGGPATIVSWQRDGVVVSGGITELIDPVTATYTSTLTVTGRETGSYSCVVSNSRSSATSKMLLLQAAGSPTNVHATPTGTTGFKVFWMAPNSGATVTGYRIYYNGGTDKGSRDAMAGDTTVTIGNHTWDLTYSIKMVALSNHLPSPVIRAEIVNSGLTVCTNGDIRLQGSTNPHAGRVEICNNNQWGTVCQDWWGFAESDVVCRQLGFQAGAILYSSSKFGQGTGPILLDNVQCTGSESRLVDCHHRGIGRHNCNHNDDIGVKCQDVGIFLNGVTHVDSIVNIMDIGTSSASLACRTTYRPCCSAANPETQWYFPNGSTVPNPVEKMISPGELPYYSTRSPSGTVYLHRNPEGITTGNFRCNIPGANGTIQSPYVGIYTSTTGVGILLNGVIYPNNSIVTIMEIGTGSAALLCTTTLPGCCFSGHGGGWFYPNGSEVINNVNLPYYRKRAQHPGAVLLHRSTGTTTGIFRCDIPGYNNVLQSLYVGIYTSTTGGPSIQGDIRFQLTSEVDASTPVFALTCTSTGGPATIVSWQRDGVVVSGGTIELTDSVTTTYTSTLTVTGRKTGSYSCVVKNDRSSATSQMLLIQAAGLPTNVHAMPAGILGFKVSWTAPTSGATVTGYRIYYRRGADEGSTDILAGDTSVTISNCTWSLTNSVRIVALSNHLPSPVVWASIATFDVWLTISQQHNATTNIKNRGVVHLAALGTLLCKTNYRPCCSTVGQGGWYYPNGSAVPPTSSGATLFTSRSSQGYIALNQRNNFSENSLNIDGVYSCEVPDASGTNETLHVGVYSGPVSVLRKPPEIGSSIHFVLTSQSDSTFILTCTSTKRPPTYVTWTRNGTQLSDDCIHSLSQSLVNGESATFHNILTVMGRLPGLYRCQVMTETWENRQLFTQTATKDLIVLAADPPTGLGTEVVGKTSIRVFWSAPVSGATVKGYRIFFLAKSNKGSHIYHTSVDVGANATQYIRDGARAAGHHYSITIVALSKHLPSAVVGPVEVILAPSTPTITMAVSQSPASIMFNWTQPVGEIVDSYEITFSYQGPCSEYIHANTVIVDGATRQHTLTGLQEFSTYTISITAMNGGGRSATTSQNVTTVAAAPTAAPQVVTASATGPKTISIDWNSVDCIERNSKITGYTLHYNSTNGTATTTSLPTNNTTYTVTGLTPSTNYSVKMAAINSNGEIGPFTLPIPVKTLSLTRALVHNDTVIPDHGFVLLEDIGEYGAQSLLCLTNQTNCCNHPSIGDWYFPNQTTVPMSDALWEFHNSRGPSVVRMHRRTGGVVGIYHCQIPHQNRVDTFYVGVYTTSTGVPNITSLWFQLTSELNATTPAFTLTCTSTGGPATAVSWTVNNHIVTEDSAHHITSQILRDPVTATYKHTLMVTGRRAGYYECNVSNNKPSSASRRLMVEGASPPTNLSAEPTSPTSIRISWTPPVSGATVVGYRIYYQAERVQDGPINYGSVDVGASVTQHSLFDLQVDLVYTITMVTKSQYLPSIVAGPVTAVLAMVRVKVVNATALLVSWDALRNTHHYTIYYSAFSPELFKVVYESKIVVPSTRTSDIVVIRELTAGVEHQFQVTSSLEVQGGVNERERSFLTANSKIVFDEAAFHLQMGPVSSCSTWSNDKAEEIMSYIHSGIAKAISYQCNCSFPVEFIRDGLFRCWNAPDEFTYRSAIVGTEAHNATELVQFLEEWVNSEPALQVGRFELWVDTKCPVLISSLKLKGEGKCS